MKIKKQELVGFKSFKDKTVIQFDGDITGIVGPNGCGKSNIIDALMWVMGEQSAKQLRGASMDQVIFGGTSDYAPAGYSEVTLVLENDGGPFPTKYSAHSEIQITRKLHRNGESEYLINREQARLRDIQEIFMDTGAGSKGFSIIQQDQISKITTAKPEDRRTLIEEAAGITKFKVRKRESQRKLETVEQNLLRLSDIVGELKRQLESLERQSKRAARYRELKMRIEELDLWITSKKYLELKNAKDAAEKIYQEAQAEEVAVHAEVSEIDAQAESINLKMTEMDMIVQDLQAQSETAKLEVRRIESELQNLRIEVESGRRQQESEVLRRTELEAKRNAFQSQFEEYSAKVESAQSEMEEAKSELETVSEQNDVLQSRLQDIDSELTGKRRELIAVGQTEVHLKSQVRHSEEKETDAGERLRKSQAVLAELDVKKAEFEARFLSLSEASEAKKASLLEKSESLKALQAQKQTLDSQIYEGEEEVQTFKDNLNKVAANLYGLENLQANFEGFEEGVKKVMLWTKSRQEAYADGRVADGSVGKFETVSELVEVDPRFEVAMEAALGNRLQLLVSETASEPLEAIQYLKDSHSGRSSFLFGSGELEATGGGVGSVVAPVGVRGTPAPTGEGVLAQLSDVVKAPEAHRATVDRLLGKTAVVDGLRRALALRAEHPDWTFVTEDGDVLNRDGVLTGGSADAADSGLLRRGREIKELSAQKDEWAGKLSLAQLSLDKLLGREIELGLELKKAQEEKSQMDLELVTLRKDLERADHENQNAQDAIDRQKKDIASSEDHLRLVTSKLEEVRKALSEMEEKKGRLESETASLDAEYNQARDAAAEAEESLNELQIRSAKSEQALEGVKSQFTLIEKTLSGAEAELSALESSSAQNRESLTINQGALDEIRARLEGAIQLAENIQREVSEKKNEYELVSQEARSFQARLNDRRKVLNELVARMNESRLKADQSQLNVSFLENQVLERYMMTLSEIAEARSQQPWEFEASEAELSDLRDKIKKLGEVNLASIEEYEDVSKRYEFLSTQQADLLESREHLKKVIDRINRICSKRFKETFEAVNERFKTVFPMIFKGGEAWLSLIEDIENGEMGVDITARPAGKKPQSMTLLSGGEKALTAIALVFAIFLVKPSPYCLLDEVDAPLDDANVSRFNDLVREMSKRSQIILITHKQPTMRVCSRIYGVTMQEKGVSKMVSVNLEQAQELVEA
ncbi:MAG: chromosome segregation protein SMC [Bdellovibrionales bacterium]|nr:chromosome segregation protein SMC [Bdellovibrionales bacterium]